jgi:hypothetical protein
MTSMTDVARIDRAASNMVSLRISPHRRLQNSSRHQQDLPPNPTSDSRLVDKAMTGEFTDSMRARVRNDLTGVPMPQAVKDHIEAMAEQDWNQFQEDADGVPVGNDHQVPEYRADREVTEVHYPHLHGCLPSL